MFRGSLITVAGLAAIAGSIAWAQPARDTKPATPTPPAAPAAAGQPEMTDQQMKDMQACMEAATPGPMHSWLAESVGTWAGKTRMWMAPGAPAMESDCVNTITAVLDGRFVRCEISGEMPDGMGMFFGSGVAGFDNVAQEFQMTWIDNWGTGIMTGKGQLSSDKKVMTWTCGYNCPITKKPVVMREVETRTGKDAYKLEMFGKEPHSGVEFKMMEIAFTRTPGGPAGAAKPASPVGASGGR